MENILSEGRRNVKLRRLSHDVALGSLGLLPRSLKIKRANKQCHGVRLHAAASIREDFCFSCSRHIAGICREPLCVETILQKLFADYGLTMSFEQYVLAGSTVRSYLAWLKDNGRVSALFRKTAQGLNDLSLRRLLCHTQK